MDPETQDPCLEAPELCEPGTCGDGTCNPDAGENCDTCAEDCGTCCGDGTCGGFESCGSCPEDCGACVFCGDGSCNNGETFEDCPDDCVEVPVCGDGICSAGESCDEDCTVVTCGDGICDAGIGENYSSCLEDCPPENCGNGICETDKLENCWTCPVDCEVVVNEPCEPPVEFCGDGFCSFDVGESCEVCDLDCTCQGECGDGNCADGETCEDCPSDCGECPPYCGDGKCMADIGEDCETCKEDCGECTCTDYGSLNLEESEEFEEEVKSPKIFGTGAKTKITSSVSASGSIGAEGCKLGTESGGSVEVCGGILWNEICVTGSASSSLNCEMPLICENPPLFECDLSKKCCDASVSGGIGVSRTWEFERKFSIASCEFFVTAGLAGDGTVTTKEGPGCDCSGLSASVKGTLSGGGGGKCAADLWGWKPKAGASATASACATKTFASGCVGGGGWKGGAQFTVKIGPIEYGWFSSWSYTKSWKAGDGC